MDKAIDEHLVTRSSYRLEIRMLHKTKGYRWFETSGQALWNEENEPTRMAGSIIDIHEHVVANEKVEHHTFYWRKLVKWQKLVDGKSI